MGYHVVFLFNAMLELRNAVTKNNNIMNAMVELLERNAYRLPESSREVTNLQSHEFFFKKNLVVLCYCCYRNCGIHYWTR